jgi:hypothetical protein
MAAATRQKKTAKAELNGEVPPGQVDIDGAVTPADPVPPVEEIRVDGTVQLSMFDLGGKRATTSSLRLTGGAVKLVDGAAYKKGDVLTGTFTAVVNEVGQKDDHDPKTGIVVSATQKHSARITDLRIKGAK